MIHATIDDRPRTEKPSRRAPLAAVPPPAPSPVVWNHVPLVPQVVVVGQRDGMPVAVIDQVGNMGFRAGLCSGKSVGIFRTLDECKRAVTDALDAPADA